MEISEAIDVREDSQLYPDTIEIGESARNRILQSFQYLQDKIKTTDRPIYGVNTGFGSLCQTIIPPSEIKTLQRNLLISHACGVGEVVPEPICRLMLLLKIKSLSFGFSGVSLPLVERMVEFYNKRITPVVYNQGSLGASGDLAPLAHLALPLIGEGEVWHNGKRTSSGQLGFEPIQLGPKEGIALINGTQFMSAYGSYILNRVHRLKHKANAVASLSLECYDALPQAFFPQSHAIRQHPGQRSVAAYVHEFLSDSTIIHSDKSHVQDPYSFRCVPQVHGASWDAFEHITEVFNQEVNSVTDNPNVFAEDDLVLSAGNFHGQPLAINLDYLSIAISEIGSISERRIYRLLEGKRGLPLFLTESPGLNSGLMIAQYTAASIASQNKQLCTPSSVDTIESSNGQEDHVSMGANAATKCLSVLQNLEQILGIEWITAYRATHFRQKDSFSSRGRAIIDWSSKQIEAPLKDYYLSPDLLKSKKLIYDLPE
jgi:histidine ammonia-lyase